MSDFENAYNAIAHSYSLYARAIDPKLRALGGKLIADADDPLSVDVVPELRKALAEETKAVGTPEPPAPKADPPNTSTRNTNPQDKEPGLAGFLRSFS